MSNISYYPVMTMVGHERAAMNFLEERDLSVRMPLKVVKVKARRLNKYVDTAVPYLPGYVFVRKVADWSWLQLIKRSSVVLGVIEFNGQIAEISEKAYEELRQKAEEPDTSILNRDSINPGDAIEVNSGLFDYSAGSFVKMVNDVDACVDLLVNNRHIRVVIPAQVLSKSS